MASPHTVAERFGSDIADRLARMAIDLACAAPSRDGTTFAAKVPWDLIRQTRAILEEAGVDWFTLTHDREERDRETRKRNYDARHGRDDG